MDEANNAKIAGLMLPDRGAIDDLDQAPGATARVVRGLPNRCRASGKGDLVKVVRYQVCAFEVCGSAQPAFPGAGPWNQVVQGQGFGAGFGGDPNTVLD